MLCQDLEQWAAQLLSWYVNIEISDTLVFSLKISLSDKGYASQSDEFHNEIW